MFKYKFNSEHEKWLEEMAKVQAKRERRFELTRRCKEADELPTLSQRLFARFAIRVDKLLRR